MDACVQDDIYIVEADIANFYQYIDHGMLRVELQLRTSKVDLIDVLIEFLSGIEGRRFGLPQMLEPSDWLSEVYIEMVERTLAREGWAVWRYNDDFKIVCCGYSQTLDAIESLSAAANSVGLTLAESKLMTSKLDTYIDNNLAGELELLLEDIDFDDIELTASSYGDDPDIMDFGYLTELDDVEALEFLESDESSDHLKTASIEKIQMLGRAIDSHRCNEDELLLDHVVDLMKYLPTLTPKLSEYLISIAEADLGPTDAVASTVNEVVAQVHLSEWQAVWMAYVARKLDLLEHNASLLEWVRGQRLRADRRLLAAECTLALCEVGELKFSEVSRALLIQPVALAPWYLLSLGYLAAKGNHDHAKRARAIRNSSPLNRMLIRLP